MTYVGWTYIVYVSFFLKAKSLSTSWALRGPLWDSYLRFRYDQQTWGSMYLFKIFILEFFALLIKMPMILEQAELSYRLAWMKCGKMQVKEAKTCECMLKFEEPDTTVDCSFDDWRILGIISSLRSSSIINSSDSRRITNRCSWRHHSICYCAHIANPCLRHKSETWWEVSEKTIQKNHIWSKQKWKSRGSNPWPRQNRKDHNSRSNTMILCWKS